MNLRGDLGCGYSVPSNQPVGGVLSSALDANATKCCNLGQASGFMAHRRLSSRVETKNDLWVYPASDFPDAFLVVMWRFAAFVVVDQEFLFDLFRAVSTPAVGS